MNSVAKFQFKEKIIDLLDKNGVTAQSREITVNDLARLADVDAEFLRDVLKEMAKDNQVEYRGEYRSFPHSRIARKFDGSERPKPKTKITPETGVYLSKESIDKIVNEQRSTPDGSARPLDTEDHATARRFEKIRKSLQGCETIDEEIIEIAIYDLGQAERAYFAGVYKASVIMLGAMLEGAMMGMLTRPDVVDEMKNADGSQFRAISRAGGGWADENFVKKVMEKGTFDGYVVAVNHLIRGFQSRGVRHLQNYRNAIHPYKVMTNPDSYKVYDEPIAQSHISSMVQAIQLIVEYVPENAPEEQEELT